MIESMYKFLEKIGYAHPLHPPLTHVPMGLVIGIFVFVLVAGVLRRPVLPIVAYRRIILLALVFTRQLQKFRFPSPVDPFGKASGRDLLALEKL